MPERQKHLNPGHRPGHHPKASPWAPPQAPPRPCLLYPHPDQPPNTEGNSGCCQAEEHLADTRKGDLPAGKQRDGRADAKQANSAEGQAGYSRGRPTSEEEWNYRNDGANGEEDERGDRRFPGGAAQFFRIDAQFLAGQRFVGRFLVVKNLPGHALRRLFFDAFGLIDERQFLEFCFRVGFNLFDLDVDLPLIKFPRALYRQPFAQGHGDGARQQAGKTGNENLLITGRGAGHALTSDVLEDWHRYALPGFLDGLSRDGRLELAIGSAWFEPEHTALGVEFPVLLDSTGEVAAATILEGAPVICGIAGDQQASLIGQGCVRPGDVKATFGTGGMLDVCLGPDRPAFERRGEAGCFPMVAWRDRTGTTWGTEAVMLSAGTNVEWLVEDMGLIDSPADSERLANEVTSTEGVTYVPALLGLGTPNWDYGARAALLGATRGTSAAHVVRAVLEGVAQRGADLLESARTDSGLDLRRLRIDGGMSTNSLFAQMLSDATGVPVEISPFKEATTLGAGYLAGLATGVWSGWDDIAAAWSPAAVIEPTPGIDREAARQRWAEAIERAGHWHEDLSALDF